MCEGTVPRVEDNKHGRCGATRRREEGRGVREEVGRGRWEMVARRDIRGRNDERRAFLARFLLVAMSVGSGAECPSHSPFCRSIFFLTHTFRGTPLAHLNHFLGMLSPHIISREVFATCVFEDDVLAHVNTHRSGAVDHIFNKIQPRRSVWRGDPCVKRTEVPVPPRCFPRTERVR